MLKIVLMSCLGLMTAGTLAAAAADEVRQAETQWADAVKRQDMEALNRMLSDDLVYTHSTGIIDTKSDYLSKMKSGAQKYDAIQHSDLKIRTYGDDTGVVNTRVRMTGATKGTPFNNQLLMTHVWVKKDGRWQLVAHQTTLLP